MSGMNMKLFIGLFISALLFTSCKKYQLRQPTSIEINSSLSYSMNGEADIQINSGFWNLDRLRVEGERKEGEDVFIEREYNDEQFDISNSTFPMDIPVGEYEKLRIRLKLDVVSDLAMSLSGIYYGSSQPIPFKIEFENDFLIEYSKAEADNLILEKKESYSFLLQYNHSILFGDITQLEWESANLTDINGVMTAVISKSQNDILFDKIELALPSAVDFVMN